MPTSQPRPPPSSAPVPAPVDAPSGALVFFSCANSLVLSVLGKRTEIALFEKPAVRSAETPDYTLVWFG
jgi:hypothetical protein